MNCFFGFTYFSEPGKVYGDPITQLKKGKAKQNYFIFIFILWLSYHKCNGWQRERNIIIIIFIEIASIF